MAPKPKEGDVWEDREVLFDLPFSYLKLRNGEKIFDRIEPIEDTKGNSGTKGRMVITNLRIIWHSLYSGRINLSVGLNCILSINTKVVNSGLRGTTQALYIMAAFKANKYEFIFTNLSPHSVRHYTSAVGVHKAYVASRLFRDIKLRTAIVQNKRIKLLPSERIKLNEEGVWNLSSDSGNLGTMLVTNFRVIWYADVNEGFNASLPYLVIENVSKNVHSSILYAVLNGRFKERPISSKEWISTYSKGLKIRSSPRDINAEVLRWLHSFFRIDPMEKMRAVLQEIQTLHQACDEMPNFGVEMNWGSEADKTTPEDEFKSMEEIGEPRGEMGPSLYIHSQLAQANSEESNPVYSAYLGLAIEPLKEGFTLKSLFEVQTVS